MSPDSIRKLRRRLKLTQAAAAALVGVNANTWARWERAEAKPRGLYQRKMIAALPHLTRRQSVASQGDFQGNNTGNLRLARRSSARSLLKYAATWVGRDLDECLREVYALRGRAKF